MDLLIQDFRYTVRQLLKKPAFTIVAVVTLALGVGATSAVFSLADWIAWRPLPGVRDGDRLVLVSEGDGWTRGWLSYPNYLDLAAQVPAFDGLAGEFRTGAVVSRPGQAPRQMSVEFVSSNYGRVLGLRVAPGRLFTEEEGRLTSAAPVVMISHRLWTDLFAGDSAVIGQSLLVQGKPVTIVGVAPAGFHGTQRLRPADLWMPFPASAVLSISRLPLIEGRQYRGIGVELFGRLAEGSTIEGARAQIRAVFGRLTETYPKENARLSETVVKIHPGLGLPGSSREDVASTLRLLFAVSGVLLLIAAANFTNLLVFRAAGRRAEVAVRRALGAGTARLTFQGLVENTTLGLGAGLVAALMGFWLANVFHGLAMKGLPAIDQVGFDGRAAAFALALALLLGVLVALVSPLAERGPDLPARLKNASVRGSVRGSWLREGMAVIQMGASLTLLVGALLLVGTLRNLNGVNVGFDRSVHAFSLPADPLMTPDRFPAAMNDLMARLRLTPGIESVALTYINPFSDISFGGGALRDGQDPAERGVPFTYANVSPSYFQTVGVPILKGTPFPETAMFGGREKDEQPVVLSRALVRDLFGERDPIGRWITLPMKRYGFPSDLRYQVVGIAEDSRWSSIVGEDAAGNVLYMPYEVGLNLRTEFVLRSTLPEAQLQRAISAAVSQAVPGSPVTDLTTLGEKVEKTISEQRLFARAMTALTLVALILAAVGLYALVSFSVAERTREFGIRIALGAQAKEVLDMVVRQAGVIAGIGVALGLVGSVVLSRAVASRLFGITPLEPFVYVLAVSLLIAVVLLASVTPARAATKVDPMVALRSE